MSIEDKLWDREGRPRLSFAGAGPIFLVLALLILIVPTILALTGNLPRTTYGTYTVVSEPFKTERSWSEDHIYVVGEQSEEKMLARLEHPGLYTFSPGGHVRGVRYSEGSTLLITGPAH